ncbi:hypothetical protein [Nocardia sp. CDC160]|uniref:hypothetical protein n=1 Tax=Nocardia sp. CDC160 TaxID=3112166 RepID=UPI002DBE91B5|nr:hypothetical protein [Nocardia sp. CDC160]MEC3916410.1 hypothetical protein [Nocardia sp. CDC160]
MTPNIGSGDWVSDSCTLPTAARPMRVAEFDRFFTDAAHFISRPDRTRLDVLIDTAAEPLGRDLAARETACCAFFTFTFEPTDSGVVMHIDVPATHIDVLDALETRVGAVK